MPSNEGRFEIPSGAIDGVNTVFTLGVSFKLGSVRVWLNGVLLVATDDDGYTELPPNQVQLNEAPIAGDRISVYRVEL